MGRRQCSVAFALVPLCWTAVATAAPVEEWQQSYQRANEIYLGGQIENALTAWGRLHATGVCSPDVEYNMGTAYLEQNDLGRAVFHLLRAESLSPQGADDVQHNLALSRGRVLGTGGDTEDSGVIGWDRILRGLPAGTLAEVFLVLWWLLFATLILRRLVPNPGYKKRIAMAALVLVLAVATMGVLAGGSIHARHGIRRGVLLEDETRAQEAPQAGAPRVFTAPAGTEVRLFERDNGFVKVRLPNGIAAWVPEVHVGEI